MKKTKSIKKAFDFKKTLNYGKFARGKYIVIYVLAQRNLQYLSKNLFGICVSKKHGNSVVRNKLKRWVREVYNKNEIELKPGHLIVFLYRKDIKEKYDNNTINFILVKEDIENSLKNLNLYKEN